MPTMPAVYVPALAQLEEVVYDGELARCGGLGLAAAALAAAQELSGGGVQWAASAYEALDYDQSGRITAEDFNLNARREALRDAAHKAKTKAKEQLVLQGAAELGDDFDDLPPVAPKLKATLSVWPPFFLSTLRSRPPCCRRGSHAF